VLRIRIQKLLRDSYPNPKNTSSSNTDLYLDIAVQYSICDIYGLDQVVIFGKGGKREVSVAIYVRF
jgi:hypothetical protein